MYATYWAYGRCHQYMSITTDRCVTKHIQCVTQYYGANVKTLMAKQRYWLYKSARSITSWHQYFSISLTSNFGQWTPRTTEADNEGKKISFCQWERIDIFGSVTLVTVRNFGRKKLTGPIVRYTKRNAKKKKNHFHKVLFVTNNICEDSIKKRKGKFILLFN
jgi:hypothetical protein